MKAAARNKERVRPHLPRRREKYVSIKRMPLIALETHHGSIVSPFWRNTATTTNNCTSNPAYQLVGISRYWALVNASTGYHEGTAYLEHFPIVGINVHVSRYLSCPIILPEPPVGFPHLLK